MIGTVLGNRYTILRELGSGGMAWVYLAEDMNEGTQVAVKVLYPQFSQDIAYVQRFAREAKVASGLTDPHIVKVLDYGASRDVHYLVMEYINGKDIRTLLSERGKLEWREALSIARQVGLALDHAAQFGIVHRDIKPQNLMLDEHGTVKVLDFGIARVMALPAITQSGLIGSPYYISPEQAMGEPVDIRSDLYSLGIVLFEMLTGQLPFNADNPWSVISQHIADPPPPVTTLVPEVPSAIDQLLQIALNKQKGDRFQSPGELVQAIDSILATGKLPLRNDWRPEEINLDQTAIEVYQRGLEAVRSEQYEHAVQLFSRAVQLRPHFRDAQEQLDRAVQYYRLEELYAAAFRAVQAQNWEQALESLVELSSIKPAYKDAPALMLETKNALRAGREQEALSPDASSGKPVQPSSTAAPDPPSDALDYPQFEAGPHPTRRGLWLRFVGKQSALLDAPLASHNSLRKRRRPLRPYIILYLAIVVVVFIGSGLAVISGMADGRSSPTLQERYHRAMSLFKQSQWSEAIKEFERIQAIAPSYEDVVFRKAEALKQQELEHLYFEATQKYSEQQWADVITLLTQVRTEGLGFKEAEIGQMLCDSYYRQALLLSNTTDIKGLQAAVALIGQGLDVCPTHTDLLALQKWTRDYLQAVIDLRADQLDKAISELITLEQTEPNTATQRIPLLLYNAYVRLARKKEDEGDLSQALLNYRRALAIPGIEHSDIEEKRIALEKTLATIAPTATLAPERNREPSTGSTQTKPAPSATLNLPTPARQAGSVMRYPAPVLLEPASGAIFASGPFEKIVLKWQGPEKLTPGEYYDVSILHFYNGEPVYWGTNTVENYLELTPDIGFGKADKDIFHWFVTIRATQRMSLEGKPDGPPISPKSQAWTFSWH